MEIIKNQFKEQYNKSIEFFNENNLEYYFFHVRKTIELFGKFLILDLFNLNQNIEVGECIINGSKSFTLNNNICSISDQPQSRQPEGSFFIILAKYSFYYLYPPLLNPGGQTTLKRAKFKVESCLDSLIDFYNTASEIVMHTCDTDLDIAAQARSCASFFIKTFNDLKKQISDDAFTFLNSLEVPSEEQTMASNEQVQKALQQNNDFSILDNITNYLSPTCGENYVVFLPKVALNKHGNPLTSNQLLDFYRIKWNFVVDFNKKTQDGLYEHALPIHKSSIRIITDNISEVTGTSNLTNWMFASGRMDLGGFDERQTLRNSPKMFCKIFSKIIRTGMTNDYIIFDFSDESPKLMTKIFDKLEDVFDDWDAAANRCKIVSFTKNAIYKEELQEWSKYSGIDIVFVEASLGEFLNHLSELKPESEMTSTKLLLRGKSLDLTEAKERYRAAGIEFYSPASHVNEQVHWDFYSGAEITWDELEKQYDVQRDLYRTIHQKISELIKTIRKTSIFTLRHRPGSGATTLSRRLGYDLTKDDEQGIISCTTINIRNCSNLRITEKYLCQLSEETENTPILAIVESKHIGREKFDYLVKRMADAGKKVLFFYVEPFTGALYLQKENVALLESFLKPNELSRFEEKYIQQGLQKNFLISNKKSKKTLEVIDFPLMLRDNETSDNLSSYVQEWMDELPNNLRKFCAFVSFVFKYSDLGVNQYLLKPIWKDDSHYTIMSYSSNVVTAIKKLLVEETNKEGEPTGIWRPRYNKFSSFILNSYKINWQNGISEIAKEFISLCQEAGELGSDDKDMLYSIFVIRKNADYRAIEDRLGSSLRNKFSLLIKDLNDIERSESLFCTLVDAFPNDPVFRGHFARFLYEKASLSKGITVNDRLFQDAQDQLSIAFDISPDDSDLHHMQGMLLRRKIKALENMFEAELRNNEIDDIDFNGIRTCLEEWVEDAYNSFEESIRLSPASPYGYAAESQLFKEAIEFGQKLMRCSDFSFCETDYIFSEYTEKLGIVLDLFEQICYAFKNDGLSQIMVSYPIYESVRAFHENIVGRNQESINRYRSLYASSSQEKKSLYGTLLVKSIIYSKTKTKNTRKAYRYLSRQERKEIEEILDYQKNKGDIKSYESLFMLKLYGTEDFSIDDAIDLLKEWEQQYADGEQLGWGYLNVCFYLAVCYCAKSIIGGVPNLELTSLANTYFRRSEEFAKKFDKGTVTPQCYFGERQDIHCIVDKNMKDTDACLITGVIHNIKNNKGILKMLCGVEVSFNARGFDILHDEGQTLRGVLGFSYSGPGLYDFKLDSDQELHAIIYDQQEENEITFEDLERSYIPSEDIVPNEEDANDKAVSDHQMPKTVGYIDLSLIEKDKKKNKGTVPPPQQKKMTNIQGKINDERDKVSIGGRKSYIIDRTRGFKPNCSPKEYDYRTDETVIFDLLESTKPGSDKPFYFAINVRPACEE